MNSNTGYKSWFDLTAPGPVVRTQGLTGLPPDPEWRDCPECGQSATGRYAGAFGCRRCGWSDQTATIPAGGRGPSIARPNFPLFDYPTNGGAF